MSDVDKQSGAQTSPFRIFRNRDIEGFKQNGDYKFTGMTPVMADGMARMYQSGFADGRKIKLIFDAPGFSLIQAWFKSGFPLPIHSHDADCLYYITAGSVSLGTETLGAGDGFFVPAGVPYTYTPGPDGVEVLEFRHTTDVDVKYTAKAQAYWDKAVQAVERSHPAWAEEAPPAGASIV